MTAHETGPILCVGPLGLDMHVHADGPRELGALSEWAGVGRVSVHAAGSIGYTALALAGLGHRIRLRSTIGDDIFGQEAIKQFQRSGIDTEGVTVAVGDTGLAIYLRILGAAKRPMVFRMPHYAPWPSVIDLDGAPAPRALVISGALHFPEYARDTLPTLLRACRDQGVPVLVDPQFATIERDRPWIAELAELVALADVLCCDEDEAVQLFGPGTHAELAQAAHELGCAMVVIKLGSAGAFISSPEGRFLQPPAFIATRVRSTVGSGDVFLAGLVDALVRDEDVRTAVRWATAVAAAGIVRDAGAPGVTCERASRMLEQVPRGTEEER